MSTIDFGLMYRTADNLFTKAILALLLAFGCSTVSAQSTKLSQHDALAALNQVAYAGKTLDYTGVFVIQKGEYFETCKITHLGSQGQEKEKIERLDGDPIEITRVGPDLLVYMPGKKIVKSETGVSERSFPSLTQDQIATVGENYDVFVGTVDRIAGRFATHITLLPKDKLRYRHELWIDQKTGLQIKAQMYTERNELVEQIMFTEVVIGNHVSHAMTRSAYEDVAHSWKLDRGARSKLHRGATVKSWLVNKPPPGFKQVMQLRRKIGEQQSRVHLVFSDGFAAISIFIDTRSNNGFRAGLAKEGSLNVYRRVLDDQFVTVLGDVPANTVKRIGDSLVKH